MPDVFTPPKTKAGQRAIKIGPVTLRQLEAHRGRQAIERAKTGDRWRENDLVFPIGIGTPLDYKRITHEYKILLKRAGAP